MKFFFNKYRYSDILLKKHKFHLSRLFCCNYTCYCVNMVSVSSPSRYQPRYQSRSSMYICGLYSRNLRNWPRLFGMLGNLSSVAKEKRQIMHFNRKQMFNFCVFDLMGIKFSL